MPGSVFDSIPTWADALILKSVINSFGPVPSAIRCGSRSMCCGSGLLFAAVYGTGKVLPIAGAGLAAKLWQENTARILIAIGSLGRAGAVLALLSQWHWAP